MNVLHVIPSLSLTHGGPSVALPAIARALLAQGVEVTISTTDDDGAGRRLAVQTGKLARDTDGAWRIYFRKNLEFYKVSVGLRSWLRQHVADYDVVHVHALFSFSSVVAARAAAAKNVPYIVRPLGVLNRWGMQNRRRMVKSWSFRMLEMPIIRRAAAIHFTAAAEREEAISANREIATVPSVVIPLPLEAGPQRTVKDENGRGVILFLSRIDPKKGLELLLDAFGEIAAEFPTTDLVIAGDGEADYVGSLKRRSAASGVADRVQWPGFVAGEQKAAALAAATIFVLPSHSENFGIAAAEALGAAVPCVLSENVALARTARAADAALVIPCKTDQLAQAMRQLLGDAELRQRLAANGLG